jgi:hypothetical protein
MIGIHYQMANMPYLILVLIAGSRQKLFFNGAFDTSASSVQAHTSSAHAAQAPAQ